MPDPRAVVNACDVCNGTGRSRRPLTGRLGLVDDGLCPVCTPRAVVAISDDQQWKATREGSYWFIWWYGVHAYLGRKGWWGAGAVEDTGQSADEVLTAFLRDR